MQIQAKNIVITGGASGLGEATARAMVSQGAQVILVDLNQELGDQLVAELGQQASFYAADVTSEEQVQHLFEHIEQRYGRVHGLVNCAGIAPAAKVLGRDGLHDLTLFQKVLNINVTGSFNMIRYATQLMAKIQLQNGEEERGVVINTASVAAYDGQIGQAAYAASKGAIVAMTLPLARELAKNAIRVMTIAPGIMETPMLKGLPQNVQDALGQMVPFPPRLAKPAE